MCIQFEREDILSVYVEKQRDVGLLSIAEQEMIISQADGHLKCAKGKAMLPQINKKDVEHIFEVIFLTFNSFNDLLLDVLSSVLISHYQRMITRDIAFMMLKS